jgi:hypothetical protein
MRPVQIVQALSASALSFVVTRRMDCVHRVVAAP